MMDVRPRRGADYDTLASQLAGLFHGERDAIANAANAAALLFNSLEDINWAGFYFLNAGTLVVGPFQGQPACVRIELGRGVCGVAAQRNETQVVPDVHAFDGHIACDPRSRSEIVVPLVRDGRVYGVLDIDSPVPARFDDDDRRGLETLAAAYTAASDPLPY